MSKSDLVARLESAPQGSRELDYLIFRTEPNFKEWDLWAKKEAVMYRDGWTKGCNKPGSKSHIGPIKLRKRKEQAINFYNSQLEETASHYTTSLDAALPDENIESVALHDVVEGEPLGTIWEAWHINPETRRRTMGAGNTEPLARRAAALKAQEMAG